jgi:hypothetical protein
MSSAALERTAPARTQWRQALRLPEPRQSRIVTDVIF